MPTAIVTSKGQITIPIEVRKALKIRPGVRINFYETYPGHFSFIAKTGSIRDLKGILPKLGYVPTIEDMNQAAMDHVAELDAVTKSDRRAKPKDEEAA
jgi:AbrB family looped-hinge helix DNA binding protein